jgi:hypothetical protein
MSSVSRYSNTINNFKDAVSSYFTSIIFNGGRKVKADSIIVFKPKKFHDNYPTFAFSFNFLGLNQKNHSVTASFKPISRSPTEFHDEWARYRDGKERKELNRHILKAPAIHAQSFNEQLKKLTAKIKSLDESEIDYITIIDLFNEYFVFDVSNISSTSEVLKTRVIENSEAESSALDDSITQYHSKAKNLTEANKHLNLAIKASGINSEIEALEKKLKEQKLKLAKFTSNKKCELQINYLETAIDKSEAAIFSNIKGLSDKQERVLECASMTESFFVRKELTDELKAKIKSSGLPYRIISNYLSDT